MAFRYPGVDVALCTALWILIAAAAITIGITEGHFPWYFGFGVVTGIAALGMWFQIRSAGYIFGRVNAVLTLLGLFGLMLSGFSIKPAVRVAGTLYAACIAFQWAASQTESSKNGVEF